ncbi:hypothetical protein Ct61P_15516 [Colletotrichum tofieldiae]|nr:hypothetical protein Ct61P_15516 [Colletotrichum tofieldiae]
MSNQRQYQHDIGRVPIEMGGRIQAMARCFHTDAGTLCLLFDTKLINSRPALALFTNVRKSNPDSTILEFHMRFDLVPMVRTKDHLRRATKPDLTVLKEAIQHCTSFFCLASNP